MRALLRLLMLGYRVAAFHEEGAALFREGKALLATRGDLRTLALLTQHYASIRQNAGEVRDYLELASEATHLADRTDDLTVRAGVRVDLSWGLLLIGRLAESIAMADEGLALVAGGASPGVDLFGYSSHFMLTQVPTWAFAQMGRVAEAETRLGAGLRLAREHGPMESVCWAHAFHYFVADASGDVRRGLSAAQAVLEAAEHSGSPHALAVAFVSLGMAHTLAGDWDRAIDAGERGLSMMREKGVTREFEASVLTTLARAHLGRGDVMRAEALADEAVALARSQGTLAFLCGADVVRALALIARDGARAAAEVEPILAEAEELIAETGARIRLPEVHLARAELARLSGDKAGHERSLREALRLYHEMGAVGHAERTGLQLSAVARDEL